MTDATLGKWKPLELTRRNALVGGTLLSTMLLPRMAYGQESSLARLRPPRLLSNVDHAIVYRRENEFSGWLHTMGFWQMPNGELLQHFPTITTDYGSADAINHDRVSVSNPSRLVQVRSKDWGRTWSAPAYNPYDKVAKGSEDFKALSDFGAVDYADPDTLVSANSTSFAHADAKSWIRISRDRGNSWTPQVQMPMDGLLNVSARESVLVRPDGTVLSFMMEVDKDAKNRHPLVYALPPRGTDFHFLSFVTEGRDPYGTADTSEERSVRFSAHRWMYPRGYLLPDGRILCVLRCQRDPRGIMWCEVYASDDGGTSWNFLSRVNDFGAPGSLVVKKDGRLVMVYAYRLMPSGIRARVSEDGGKKWGPELIVRDDGGSWDLGYPNAWELDDGRIGVIYYFNSNNDRINVNGGVRHIERSIFSID